MKSVFRPALRVSTQVDERHISRGNVAMQLQHSAPIGLALVVMLSLRLVALWLDPEHRLWLPVSLLQGSEFWFTGDGIIMAPLWAAGCLLSRMILANEWEEVLVLVMAISFHLQLLMPWGRVDGAGHSLFAMGAFAGYAWVLVQSGIRNQRRLVMIAGGLLLLALLVAASALNSGDIRTFGIVEHLLLGGLAVVFWWYDRSLVSAAIIRESSPQTCRLNSFGPPYL